MIEVYSRTFYDQTTVDIFEGIAGDWEELDIRIAVKASLSSCGIYLLPTIDAGLHWINSGFHAHPILMYDPSTFVAVPATYGGMLLNGNTVAGALIDSQIILRHPNDGDPRKHSRLQAEANNGTFFSWQMGGEITMPSSMYGGMINGLRLLSNNANCKLDGHISIVGKRRQDVFPEPDLPVKKVAIIGPSTVSIGGYFGALQAALQAIWTDRTVIVRNFGSGGMTSIGGLNNIGNVIACEPDIVILSHLAADSVSGTGINETICKANHNAVIDAIWAANESAEIYIASDNPFIGPAAPNFPNVQAFYQYGRDVATARGIGFIEVHNGWGTATLSQYNNSDGAHPTPAANVAVRVPIFVAALTA